MKPAIVKKQWRAVGACEFDVFFRDRKDDPDFDDIVGEPEEVFSVMQPVEKPTEHHTHVVIADCYSLKDAKTVAKALNAMGVT